MFSFGGNRGHGQGVAPSNSTSRLLSDFRNGSRGTQRGPPDPAKDIHRMLESYSNDISKTEDEIERVHRQREAVEEKQVAAAAELVALRGAAAAAADDAARLAAQVQHLQAEVTAKKEHNGELMSKIAAVQRKLDEIRLAGNQQREDFIEQSYRDLETYRQRLHGKGDSWCEAATVDELRAEA